MNSKKKLLLWIVGAHFAVILLLALFQFWPEGKKPIIKQVISVNLSQLPKPVAPPQAPVEEPIPEPVKEDQAKEPVKDNSLAAKKEAQRQKDLQKKKAAKKEADRKKRLAAKKLAAKKEAQRKKDYQKKKEREAKRQKQREKERLAAKKEAARKKREKEERARKERIRQAKIRKQQEAVRQKQIDLENSRWQKNFLSKIGSAIYSTWEQPSLLEVPEGTRILLRLKIARSGRVLSAKLIESGRNSAKLKPSAQKLIRKLGRFPAFPKDFPEDSIEQDFELLVE